MKQIKEKINYDALTRKIFIEVQKGSLDNIKGDIDRINSALLDKVGMWPSLENCCKHDRDVIWPLDLIETASKIVQKNENITLTIETINNALKIIAIEPSNTVENHFGIAIDLGTTVVAAELINLNNGKILASSSEQNNQIIYGEDLLTRLHLAAQGGLKQLNKAIVNTINRLIKKLCKNSGVNENQISALTVAGNTAMSHIFLGLNPSSLRQAPFIPVINNIPILEAKELGIKIAPHATTYIFPSVGSYLGGDIVSGVLASDLSSRDEISLFIDIGTNGEMVLGNKDWLIAGAGAAGPALEGGVAECAGRAEPGAIDKLTIDPITYEPSYHTISNKRAKSLCGSGLVDLIAELYKTGLIDATGRFNLEIPTNRWAKIRDRQAYVINFDYKIKRTEKLRGTSNEHKLSKRPTVYITNRDIENFMRTKAAMNAALTILLESVGLSLSDIKRIFAAGSFGIHISVESAKQIGLYPNLPTERFVILGNGSLLGARKVLLDKNWIKHAKEIADKTTYLQLSLHPRFMELFRSYLYFS